MTVFWSVVGLGLLFSASPGPINLETLRRGLHEGPWSAFSVQVGSLIAELGLGGMMLLGLVPLIQHPGVHLTLTVLSIGVLLAIAWTALRDARRTPVPGAGTSSARRSLLLGALAAASNPLSPMVWVSIIGVAAASDYLMSGLATAVLVGLGYLLGALSWAIVFTVGIGWGRSLLAPRFWRWWNVTSGAIIGGYGIHLLWQTVQGIL